MATSQFSAAQQRILEGFSDVARLRTHAPLGSPIAMTPEKLAMAMKELLYYPEHVDYIFSLQSKLQHKSPEQLNAFWKEVWGMVGHDQSPEQFAETIREAKRASSALRREAAPVAKELMHYLVPRLQGVIPEMEAAAKLATSMHHPAAMDLAMHGAQSYREAIPRGSAALHTAQEHGLFSDHGFMHTLFQNKPSIQSAARSGEASLVTFFKPIIDHVQALAPKLSTPTNLSSSVTSTVAHTITSEPAKSSNALVFASISLLAVGMVALGIMSDSMRKKGIHKDASAGASRV